MALMALGSLALWTAIPGAWLWLTRDLDPGGARFLVAVVGCAISMLLAGSLLVRLQAIHARISGATLPQRAARSGWVRSVSDQPGTGGGLTALEKMLAISAVVALLALVGWWAFFSDSDNPSGPTAPGTEHGSG